MLLKQKLARGEVVTMLNPDHPSPSLVEFIGGLGVDAIFIDCEHGMAGPERVQEMCRAARLAGVVPVVRPEAHQPWLVTRYLDAGAGGVMVPHIDTAEDARQLVATVRNADAAAVLIVVLLESTLALDNLPSILGVEGIDVFFVGPGDLSKSLGLPGQRFHPQVRSRVEAAGRTIVAAGKVAGTLVRSDNAADYVNAGFRFLYEHANALLAESVRRFVVSLAPVAAASTAPPA